MSLRGKKLGVLVSGKPALPGFRHGVRLAAAALDAGAEVYFYCIDDAVLGAERAELAGLVGRGLRLFACAYAARKRGLPLAGPAVFAGLGTVDEIIAATDRFVHFG